MGIRKSRIQSTSARTVPERSITESNSPGVTPEVVSCLLRLSLGCNSSSGLCNGFFVGQVVVADGFEVGIELVDERNSSRNVELNNVRLRDVVEVLNKCSKGVSVCGNENPLARLDSGRNLVVPERQKAIHGVEQRLAQGELLWLQISISSIVPRPVDASLVQGRRGKVVRAAPDFDLRISRVR